jgi:2-keto-4-pentenoate hydratase/2-oxohepta-3-ene-1,7-dioic acid hydratase in catechol pathway
MKLIHFSFKDLENLYGILDEEKKLISVITKDSFKGDAISFEEIKILPVSVPTKIIAIGLNYIDHANEMDKPIPEEPLLFMKPNSAVIAHNEEIILPEVSKRVDYEGELAVVIGQKCKNIEPDEVDDYILGYTCFNDVTARDLQEKDGQYTRSKSFDTFAPVGPWMENNLDVDNLDIETKVNGRTVQKSNTSNMKFKPKFLVSYISKIMTLFPGDIIATGTPSGVGPLQYGDTVEVTIEGIGTLVNKVKK